MVITLYKNEQSARRLRDFSIRVGLFTTAAMVIVAALGLDKSFFANVLGENADTIDLEIVFA